MSVTRDTEWWKTRIRRELDGGDRVRLDDLPQQPGLPEDLIEAVEQLERDGEISVTNDHGQRIIEEASSDDERETRL